jgi:hypothetical protein
MMIVARSMSLFLRLVTSLMSVIVVVVFVFVTHRVVLLNCVGVLLLLLCGQEEGKQISTGRSVFVAPILFDGERVFEFQVRLAVIINELALGFI